MRPLLYDVFCGGGGASKGYMNAGFRVIGIDNKPQPRYCGDGFMQMDAFEFFEWYMTGEFEAAAAFHCSPPCQAHTHAARQWRNAGREYPDLIAPTRAALKATGRPWIIENVPGAPLIDPIMLNGAMFGLRVKRDRLFEASFPLPDFLLPVQERPVKMGRPFNARMGGTFYPVGHFSGVPEARIAMEIDWMTQGELADAIPPAYTFFIGTQLLAALRVTPHQGDAARESPAGGTP